MTSREFIETLYKAGWSNPGDAQNENILELFKQWFPKDAEIEAIGKERDALQGLLTDIGDFAHKRSTGPEKQDDLWEVRRMAYQI